MKKYWTEISYLCVIVIAVIAMVGICMMTTGCQSMYPQTHEKYHASIVQRWMVPETMNGPDASMPPVSWKMARETSATLDMDHDGPLNGDSRTSGTLRINPDGSVVNEGGRNTGFPSAVSALHYLVNGIVAGISYAAGKGGL